MEALDKRRERQDLIMSHTRKTVEDTKSRFLRRYFNSNVEEEKIEMKD